MDFKDLGGVTLEKLDAYIKLCDAVVHLVGDLTGPAACNLSTEAILCKYPGLPRKFPPLGEVLEKGEPISYTQWEAWLALYHSKVLLIAKADCDAPRGLAYAPTDCSRMAQEKHLARLREVERYPGNVFTSPDNLAKQIALTTILDLLAKAQSTSRQFSGSDVAKTIGLPVAAAFSVLAIWLAARPLARLVPEGPMLPLAIVIVGICVLAIPFVYVFYLGLLAQGANPEGSIERQDYDRLRASLAGGNLAARLYSKWLTKFLDWIERFFGDPGMEDRTLFPHAFGLRKPAPLWTAPAFDRCMFLALIYPISTIFLIWTISGHVGPAEAALGLKPNLLGWRRSLIATTAALEGFVTWTLFWGKGPKSITWSYAGFPRA
jgi:hypothetical protein